MRGSVLAIAALVSFGVPAAAQVAVVSAANYGPSVAPDSIAAMFGSGLASGTDFARQLPLPTALAGASITVNGTAASLFFASASQINFLVPPGTQPGQANVMVRTPSGTQNATITIANTAPAVFTANTQGWGAPAAHWVPAGAPDTFNLTFNADGSPANVPGGAMIVLYGTGWRRAPSGSVTVTVLGANRSFNASLLYAGAQPGFAGLDQINVILPNEVNGGGNIDLVIIADGVRAGSVRLLSGTASSSTNSVLMRLPAGLRNFGLPVLSARGNFAASVANYDATQCGTSLVMWDLDRGTAVAPALPGGACMLDAVNGPGVLMAAPRVFGRARNAAAPDNFQTNLIAIGDLTRGSVSVVQLNNFWIATPEQFGESLVFPGKQQPRDVLATSIVVVDTAGGTVDAAALPAGDRFDSVLKPAVDATTRTALFVGEVSVAFARLPSSPGAGVAIRGVSAAGAGPLAEFGTEVLPAAGHAVGIAAGATTAMALFYNLSAQTIAPVALPSDVNSICWAAGAGNGLEDLDSFASIAGHTAVSLYPNGCNRFLVFDGARQTVTPMSVPGVISMSPAQALNNFVFAAGRAEAFGEFNRLVVLRDGTRVSIIAPPQAARIEPTGFAGYATRAVSNEVFVPGITTDGRQALFMFRLTDSSAVVIEAPSGIALTTAVWTSRRPDRAFAFAYNAAGVPQIITFDLNARSASSASLPDGTFGPVGFNADTSLVLFDHREGVIAVRLD